MSLTPTYILHESDLYKAYSDGTIVVFYDNDARTEPAEIEFEACPLKVQAKLQDSPNFPCHLT